MIGSGQARPAFCHAQGYALDRSGVRQRGKRAVRLAVGYERSGLPGAKARQGGQFLRRGRVDVDEGRCLRRGSVYRRRDIRSGRALRLPDRSNEEQRPRTNLGAGGYQYLGNLAAGTEGSVDFDIVPDAAGTVSGIITLNYEDASGNPQTISKDFSVSAEEMNMDDFNYDPSMDDTQPEQTGMPVWAWVLIGVCGAVVVIVVIVVVVRKRKKAKALAALEAEDSDEDL